MPSNMYYFEKTSDNKFIRHWKNIKRWEVVAINHDEFDIYTKMYVFDFIQVERQQDPKKRYETKWFDITIWVAIWAIITKSIDLLRKLIG